MLAGDDFEPSPGNYTGITTSTDQGRTWKPLQVSTLVCRAPGKTTGQGPTELMILDGRCTLFFSTHSQTWGTDWKSWMRHSEDAGKTWDQPCRCRTPREFHLHPQSHRHPRWPHHGAVPALQRSRSQRASATARRKTVAQDDRALCERSTQRRAHQQRWRQNLDGAW